ncbi:hypothetical protein HF1_04840 [Mycoplasma haemofelis str. Langford 1]|uniref:Uncharacterized protein n=1 Tax=Mycoplasma haemofelis (strain Langford 1) TaxID=941640 RepID=E8ZH71_MYCHL|nr:hypothetical protein [Mycoplasma haemofelis]CBY92492.1 hypothetical protein HF1_04840 [Mycoplasma haemofelis str. Langford 1]
MVSKAGVAAVGALGAGTASYMGYEYVFNSKEEVKKTTIRERLGDLLLDTSSSDKWAARKTKLSQAEDTSLVEELKSLKSGVSEDQVKGWCSGAATKTYEDVSALYFENVRTYCTFYIEDKLPEGYLKKESGDWSKASDRLKNVQTGVALSDQMKAIKDKLTTQGSSGTNDDLKNWCVGVYEKPFLGEDNQDFVDAKVYCAKIEEASTGSVSPAAA